MEVTEKSFQQISFIRQNTEDCLQSRHFLALPEAEVKRIIQDDELDIDESEILQALFRWGRAEAKRRGKPFTPPNVQECIKPLLPFLRFSAMSPQEFTTQVVSPGLLTPEECCKIYATRFSAFGTVPKGVLPPRNKSFISVSSSSIFRPEQLMLLRRLFPAAHRVKLTLLYRKTRDGATSRDFHQKCDNQGPTLTVIQSQNSDVMGAYNEAPWTSQPASVECDSWLFRWNTQQPGPAHYLKFLPVSNARGRISLGHSTEPVWGANDLRTEPSGRFDRFSSSLSVYRLALPVHSMPVAAQKEGLEKVVSLHEGSLSSPAVSSSPAESIALTSSAIQTSEVEVFAVRLTL